MAIVPIQLIAKQFWANLWSHGVQWAEHCMYNLDKRRSPALGTVMGIGICSPQSSVVTLATTR